MNAYYDRDFDAAIEGFERVLSISPEDANAMMLIDRCRRYRLDPPPKGWDGVEVMTTK